MARVHATCEIGVYVGDQKFSHNISCFLLA